MIHQVTAFTHCHLLIILYPKMKQFAISIKFIGIITIRKEYQLLCQFKKIILFVKINNFPPEHWHKKTTYTIYDTNQNQFPAVALRCTTKSSAE